MDKIVPFPGDFDVVDTITVPRVLASYFTPAGFTAAHANDPSRDDPAINDDLIGTRGAEDELAVFEVPKIQTVAANVDWVNKYYGAYNISNRTKKIEYIVVHYTGSGTPKAGAARNNCIYFSGGNRNASADFFIDDSGIWEYTDSDRYYTWHCGDGGGKYGIRNSNSIGIEVCQNGDNPYSGNEILFLTRLVGFLMNKYNIPPERVVRHYDASRKQCPYHYTIHPEAWKQLHATTTNGEEIVTEDQMQRIAELAAEKVWNFVQEGWNGPVKMRDRIVGIDKKTEQLTMTDDPANNGSDANTRVRVAWIARKQNEMKADVTDIKSMLADHISRS